jgi:hypothetical protein
MFLVLRVLLRAKKAADYVIQSMRRKMLSHSLAPAIAVWTSGEEPFFDFSTEPSVSTTLFAAEFSFTLRAKIAHKKKRPRLPPGAWTWVHNST